MAIPLHIEGLVLGVKIHSSPEGGIHRLSTNINIVASRNAVSEGLEPVAMET
jgi:hypothetical protein